MKKIGVFDSGIGGKSVAIALQKAIPEASILFLSDPENLPYGTKTAEQLKVLVEPKIKELLSLGVDMIVIACNTVSTTIIDWVKSISTVPVIGVEPLVEAASVLTKNKVIAVCATPTTLSSKRYANLKKEYAKDIKVIEPDCSRWTKMIEDNQVDREEIYERVNNTCVHGADVVVLGCTHYHWIEELIRQIVGDRAVVIQPENLIIQQVKELISNT